MNSKYSVDIPSDGTQAWEAALENMTLEQLRQIVRELAVNDEKLQRRLTHSNAPEKPARVVPNWKEEIMEMVWEVADEDDYIDYDHAFELMSDIAEYIRWRRRPLMQQGDIEAAFDMVMTVHATVHQLDMDNTDEGLSEVVAACNEALMEICSAANDDQRTDMCQQLWVMHDIAMRNYGSHELIHTIVNLGWNEAQQQENLQRLDLEIRKAGERDYWLPEYLSLREQVMRNLGASEEDVVAFWKPFSKIPAARERLLELYMKCDPETAITMLRENKAAERKDSPKIRLYSEKLIQLYQETGRQKEYEAELQYLVMDCHCICVPYLKMLKEITAPKAWKEMVERLLAFSKSRYERFDLLCFEEQYERLISEVIQGADIHHLNRYEEILKQWSPERTRDGYVAVLKRDMERANTRKSYRAVIGYLEKLEAYPDGTETAEALADFWRLCFNTRSAMKEELRREGY